MKDKVLPPVLRNKPRTGTFREKARIERAGGLYLLATSMEQFIEQWQAHGLGMISLEYLRGISGK